MVKTLTAQKIDRLNAISLETDGAGNVNGLTVLVVVDYGDRKLSESHNIWPLLSTAQKTTVQGFKDNVLAKVNGVLGL